MTRIAESEVDAAALEWLVTIGWAVTRDPDIGPKAPGAEEGASYDAIILGERLRGALHCLNSGLARERP